jgi:hypothetical protein
VVRDEESARFRLVQRTITRAKSQLREIRCNRRCVECSHNAQSILVVHTLAVRTSTGAMAQFLRWFAVVVLLLLVEQAKPFAAGPPNSVANTNKLSTLSSSWPFSSKTSSKKLSQRVSAFRFDDTHSCSADPSNNRHSASDWWYNVQSLPKSKVLRDVRNPVLAVGVWSLIVSLLHRFCRHHAIPVVRSLADHMSIPGTAHSFLVSALGLLLVFRTNSAYQRFYVRYIHYILVFGICSHSFRLFVLVSFYLIT